MRQRDLTSSELDRYKRDGAVVIRDAVDKSWIESLIQCTKKQLNNPSVWANDPNPNAKQNRMFTDRYLWRTNADIFAYIKDSGCARLAAQAMQSGSARFYFDHTLVKEPNTKAATPWHQDAPYWPFSGKQICSIWLALTPTKVETSALEFVKGSHLDDVYYLPEAFGTEGNGNDDWIAEGSKGTTGKTARCPDIEANRDQFDIIGYDLEAGDALIFSAWTLHGARGNGSSKQARMALSTRWLGDDVRWDPRPGTDPTVTQEQVCIQPGKRPTDNAFFPEFWRQE